MLRAGGTNALAVEVFAPAPTDLALIWVDWNPTPADKNMGLWGPCRASTRGAALRHPHVVTSCRALPVEARLTVTAEVANTYRRR